MRQVENRCLSWRLTSLLVVVVVLTTMAEPVTSQRAADRNSTLMRYYCSMYKGVSATYFLRNLNTTLSNVGLIDLFPGRFGSSTSRIIIRVRRVVEEVVLVDQKRRN
ncbi:hypothetical protein HanRHA438_Chr14g0655381 [Helianthus annuus]|nr:hypothetical protein HanRHA438_Chr14g0655381 [Helianthus annuus]